jgi:predicted AAA+ superfamily ATPase
MVHVSESLAGRLSLMELTPFLMSEFPADACDRLWFFGGYPDGGILTESHYPQWDKDYLQLLTQRDLPMWGLPAKPQTTLQLLRMLAAGHGQTWNASQVGQSMSLDYKTVNSYLGYLIGAFLIRQLQPYQANVKKRLVKSSKVYWRDSGLLHSMLNVSDRAALLDQPWVGASWEGFVIEQVVGFLATAGRHFEPYYLRTNDQYELDLVLDFGGEMWAMEIKLTSSPSQRDMERLNQTADLIGATKRFLISRTREPVWGETRISCNIEGLLAYLASPEGR